MLFIQFNKKPDIDLCWEEKKYMKFIVKIKKKVFSFHAGKKRKGEKSEGKETETQGKK